MFISNHGSGSCSVRQACTWCPMCTLTSGGGHAVPVPGLWAGGEWTVGKSQACGFSPHGCEARCRHPFPPRSSRTVWPPPLLFSFLASTRQPPALGVLSSHLMDKALGLQALSGLGREKGLQKGCRERLRWSPYRPQCGLLLYSGFCFHFLLTLLLRYNSHTTKFTHVKCTIRWFLIDS